MSKVREVTLTTEKNKESESFIFKSFVVTLDMRTRVKLARILQAYTYAVTAEK